MPHQQLTYIILLKRRLEIMRQKLRFEDALEILKEKAETANMNEMEIMLDLAHRMNVACQIEGTKKQRDEVNDLYRDMMLQHTQKKSQVH